MTSHTRQVFFPKNLEPGDDVLLENALYAEAERVGNAAEFVAHGEHYKFFDRGAGRPYFLNLRTDTTQREIPAGIFAILRVNDKPEMAPVFEDMSHDPDEDVEHDEEVYRQAFVVRNGTVVPTEYGKEKMQEALDRLNRNPETKRRVEEGIWNPEAKPVEIPRTTFTPGGALPPRDEKRRDRIREDDAIPVILSEGHVTSSYKSEDLAKEYPMQGEETLTFTTDKTTRGHATNADRTVKLITVREGQRNTSYQFNGQRGFIGNNIYNAITKALRDEADYIELRGDRISIEGLQHAYITETGMPDIKITIERKS